MTRRIFLSTFFVSFASVIIAIVIFLGADYTKNIERFTAQLDEEARLLGTVLADDDAEKNLAGLSEISGFSSRITYIAADGTVLFDNKANPAEMENHAQRDEIVAAKQSGEGASVRESKTLSESTIYCARVLKNGDIIRVSGTHSSVLGTIADLWWGVALALCSALILSLLLADLTANKIVKPINEIDLKNPDIDENYGEIAPLLHEIRTRNIEIENRISELSKAREEFSLITENMSEGFIITDREARVLSYNSAALRILGTDFGGGTRSIFTLNHSENFIRAVESALGGVRTEIELGLSEKIYSAIASPVLSDGEISGAVIIILDVTEKQSREELRREFTSNVSHELKTPLTTIYGISDMLAGGIVKPEDVREFSEKIKSEASRLITLIEDIINLSRMDENSYNDKREQVDLHELAEICAGRLAEAAEKNGVSVAVSGEKAVIEGIYVVLDEIVYNLLDNAIKYNKQGGKAQIDVSDTPEGVLLSVSDTGIGIPSESAERVFERFYRVDKSRSRKIGGTGLGLSIVKHGAALHGAKISLESSEGVGTTISILFPKQKRA